MKRFEATGKPMQPKFHRFPHLNQIVLNSCGEKLLDARKQASRRLFFLTATF
jgi:hypothetical protein